ncbi:MAG TPA: zinc-binding dehydrogenase [Blastocatellia bacterium]|nr:zinc-binding dehydrogenase [Blastocatellia bacterium]
MRTAVIAAPRQISFEAIDLCQPGPGEVRIKLEGCGVCASNLPAWEGRDWFHYPFTPGAPGHEGWGVIDALADGTMGLDIGDRVAFLSNRGFAEYDVAAIDSVVKLPPSLDGKPFPGEPLGCAMNIYERSDIAPGQVVAVVGIGFLGALLTQLCSGKGAHVIAISRRSFALNLAQQFGAGHTIQMDDHRRIIEEVLSLTNNRGCERVIECVGEQWPLDLAAEITAERGKLIIAGYHQDGLRTVNMQLWNWRGLDVINAHERDPKNYIKGMRAAVDAVINGEIDPSPLYTTFKFDQITNAFDALQSRPDGFVKALITI